MSDRKLCHFISKPIGDEKDTIKSFMAFNITPRGPIFRMVVGSQIVVPQHVKTTLVSNFGFIYSTFKLYFIFLEHSHQGL